MFDHRHYVPILRRKQAERQALRGLSEPTKEGMTPLIEVHPGVFGRLDRSDRNVMKDIHRSWGARNVFLDFVDLKQVEPLLYSAYRCHPVTHVFKPVSDFFPSAIPVIRLTRDRSFRSEIRKVVKKQNLGMCLRLYVTDLESPTLWSDIWSLLLAIDIEPEQVDLLLDFGVINEVAPNYAAACKSLLPLTGWRSFTISGGALPQDLSSLARGYNYYPRREWAAWYEQVVASPNLPRLPSFGDYTIQHAIYIPPPQFPKMTASIRYTLMNEWFISKGYCVSGKNGLGYEQWRANAALISGEPDFLGGDFSSGDKYIQEMGMQQEKTGNAMTWIQAGISHHLTFVVRQMERTFEIEDFQFPEMAVQRLRMTAPLSRS